MKTNIQAQKLQLMKLILETENPSILESIADLFSKESKNDYWASLTNDQKMDIEMGILEIENGETIDYESIVSAERR